MVDAVTLYFKSPDDTLHRVSALIGRSVMAAAVMNNIPGIEAECGGCCNCATCHVFAPDSLANPADEEDALLDDTATPRTAVSRLSCQIPVEPGMDGAIFAIPAEQ